MGNPIMIGARTLLAVKILVSAVTVFYGVVPALADLNETHLFNPLWSEHARFHAAWFLAFTAGVAGISLYMMWQRGEIILPIFIGLMFAGGFWVATLFGPLYGGALVDSNGYVQTILGVESNMFLFSVVTLLLVGALLTVRRLSAKV
ncbi:MAG: DUF6640 family protein [Pseudomonadota bacterium]